jgi:hypothetical protein
VLGDDDVRACGKVERRLVSVAEPGIVAGAEPVMGGDPDGNRLADAAAGRAPVAGGSGPVGDGVPCCRCEDGERTGQAVWVRAGEVGKCVQCLALGRNERVMPGPFVAAAGLRGEPGGQDGKYLGEGDVVGCGESGQVGGEGPLR